MRYAPFSALNDLIAYAASEPEARREVLTGLASMLLEVIKIDSARSSEIPSNSLWFERLPTFQPWTLTDITQTSIALQTQTLPEPKETPDHSFVARRSIVSLERILQTQLANKAHEDVADVTYQANWAAQSLAAGLAPENATILLEHLGCCLLQDLPNRTLSDDHSRKTAVATISALATSHLTVFLAFATSTLHRLGDERIRIAATDLRRKTTKYLYRRHHLREVLKRLEILHYRVRFEGAVEGDIISPAWFWKSWLHARIATIWRIACSIGRLGNGVLRSGREALAAGQGTLVSSGTIRVGLETFSKMAYHMAPLCADTTNSPQRQ